MHRNLQDVTRPVRGANMTEIVPGNRRYVTAVQALKARLQACYGATLHRVVVFGSVARHTAHAASDIDVLVIFDRPEAAVSWHTERHIREIALSVELMHDVVFDLKTADKAALSGIHGHTPFMERVLAEGVEV